MNTCTNCGKEVQNPNTPTFCTPQCLFAFKKEKHPSPIKYSKEKVRKEK